MTRTSVTACNRNTAFEQILRVPVVPVLTIADLDAAVPLARALEIGGLPVIEITLRTPDALLAIRKIADSLAGRVIVGAGTIRTPQQAAEAIAAGAAFLVSPGITPALADASRSWRVPFLPGVATASEAMALADIGFLYQKFFPAEQIGGAAALAALAAPLPEIRFCPTGGIDAVKAPTYLALSNVVAVGGSWPAPKDLIAAGDWDTISALARDAASPGG